MCSAFRNEGAGIASELIREAVAATRAFYGDPPEMGMVTFIDPKKVKPTMTHGAPTWGRTYELAGFEHVGKTKGGLLAMQLRPEKMPPPRHPQKAWSSGWNTEPLLVSKPYRTPRGTSIGSGLRTHRTQKEARTMHMINDKGEAVYFNYVRKNNKDYWVVKGIGSTVVYGRDRERRKSRHFTQEQQAERYLARHGFRAD